MKKYTYYRHKYNTFGFNNKNVNPQERYVMVYDHEFDYWFCVNYGKSVKWSRMTDPNKHQVHFNTNETKENFKNAVINNQWVAYTRRPKQINP